MKASIVPTPGRVTGNFKKNAKGGRIFKGRCELNVEFLKQHRRVVRMPDLKFVGCGLKSHSDH